MDELLEAYRQPVPMSRLLQAGKANTEEVIKLLAENDYVRVTPGATAADATVEVKHESLVRNWPRFVGWIDDKRIERRQRLALTEAARRWSESGKPAEGLLTGWQLEEARSHSNLSVLEKEFVEASSEAVERTQREREDALRHEAEQAKAMAEAERKLLRRTKAALIFVLVAAVALAGASYHSWKRAVDLNLEAKDLKRQATLLAKKQRKTEKELAQVQAAYNDLFAKEVQQVVAPANQRSSSQPVTILLHISVEAQRPRAKEIARLLQQNGIKVPGIEKVSAITRSTNLRYFQIEDEPEAKEIAKLLSKYLAAGTSIKPRLITGYEQRVPGKQYEIWFAPDALKIFPVAEEPP